MQPARARVEPSQAPGAETLEFECDKCISFVLERVPIQAVQCEILTRKPFLKIGKFNFPRTVAGKNAAGQTQIRTRASNVGELTGFHSFLDRTGKNAESNLPKSCFLCESK